MKIPPDLEPFVGKISDITNEDLLSTIKAYMKTYNKEFERFGLNVRWIYYLNTNMTADFAKKSAVDVVKAVSEIIQNAYDEVEAMYGYAATFNTDIRMDGKHYVYIADNGRGITLDAFTIGASTKECWQRGYFGFGLNLAITWLISNGFFIYIHSHDNVFIPIIFGKRKRVIVLIGETDKYREGTMVYIYDKAGRLNIPYNISFQLYCKNVLGMSYEQFKELCRQ